MQNNAQKIVKDDIRDLLTDLSKIVSQKHDDLLTDIFQQPLRTDILNDQCRGDEA